MPPSIGSIAGQDEELEPIDELEDIADEDELEFNELCEDARLELEDTETDELCADETTLEDTKLEDELTAIDDCEDFEEPSPPPPQADNINPNAINHTEENFNLYIGVTFIVIN